VPKGRAFALATGLNLVFVVAELVLGLLSGSMALLADAAHNVSDVLGLVLAWGASALARREPTDRHTYGMGKTTILAALANAVLLLITVGGVTFEAIERLTAPPQVHATTVIVVAAIGVVINGVAAALFLHGRSDVNVRAAFIHLVADAAVSAGVVLVGVALMFTGWNWLDPLVSLLISAVILKTAWSLLRDAFHLSVDAVPDHIDATRVRQFLAEQPGVMDVHDMHVWAMSSNEVALTAHIVADPSTDTAALLQAIHASMREEFGICHSTVQVEPPDATDCMTVHPADAAHVHEDAP